MYKPLVPCPSCARHVLATEVNCPFCASALPEDLEDRVIPGTSQRLSRAAAFVFGASLAFTACSSDVTSSPPGSTSGGQGGSEGQGGAASDGGVPGPDDDGGVHAEYGAPPPPVDAGTNPPSDGGGPAPLYGAPPPPSP